MRGSHKWLMWRLRSMIEGHDARTQSGLFFGLATKDSAFTSSLLAALALSCAMPASAAQAPVPATCLAGSQTRFPIAAQASSCQEEVPERQVSLSLVERNTKKYDGHSKSETPGNLASCASGWSRSLVLDRAWQCARRQHLVHQQ